MGRLSEAEGEFRLAVDAGDVLARVNYGQYLFDQGRANEAEEQLLLSIPSVESACVRLGNLYEDLGLNERAGQQFALALAEGTDAHFEYAELLARTHRLVEAEAEYRLAVDAGELAREAHLFLGEMLLKQGRIREAKEHFRLALALDEQRSATALAELLQAEGRRGEAEEHYLQALAMGDDDAQSGYGQLLLQLGRYEEAVGHLRAAAGLSHDSNELLRLGYALAKAGHGQQASRVYREYRKVKRSSR